MRREEVLDHGSVVCGVTPLVLHATKVVLCLRQTLLHSIIGKQVGNGARRPASSNRKSLAEQEKE